ncbi:shikimate dehydrogenase [Telmatospirillum siberiense]|uniref:Shikimate dehydrogenase (NADP(+)) n=1 Tax=Telmatospirillum siberiense TaxID=382514 RepID=A0A2N3PP68_9PROT|nr:shikimate dehydrogenase [Telmatospirillum siberiense]PKU22187.1 shikimate dehydrogenase [Telmatospirillum siberiense]
MNDLYAVFGNPLGHTKSPFIHGEFARQTAQNLDYIAIEASPGGFAASLDAFKILGGKGANVTAPFKVEAFALAGDRCQRAELAGASNALKFEDGRIIAENFDGVGLVADIRENLCTPLRGRRVLMLGAGGAARGAALPILEAGPASLTIINRTVAKAHALRERFSSFGDIVSGGYADLGAGDFDIVINATSASLRGELPPITERVFARAGLAYELAYGKGLTPFLKLAKRSSVDRLADGVGMLVEQAAAAFAWWRGIRPATGPMIEKITVPLI